MPKSAKLAKEKERKKKEPKKKKIRYVFFKTKQTCVYFFFHLSIYLWSVVVSSLLSC